MTTTSFHSRRCGMSASLSALVVALLYVIAASTTGVSAQLVYDVVNQGATAYLIDGKPNPTLTLTRGKTYIFQVHATGHPFWIKTKRGNGAKNGYKGASNNGATSGAVTLVLPLDAPDKLSFNCQYHVAMEGDIKVVDATGVGPCVHFTVFNKGAEAYVINGMPNPTLTIHRGNTYAFDVKATGHPFYIKTKRGNGPNNGYAPVQNIGAQTGKVLLTVPLDAPDTLYYDCLYHNAMSGVINVTNAVKIEQGAHTYTVLPNTNSSLTATKYLINGMPNPTLTLHREVKYTFHVKSPGLPFWIKTIQGPGPDNGFVVVDNNGVTEGTVTLRIPEFIPATVDTLFYNCETVKSMTGIINVKAPKYRAHRPVGSPVPPNSNVKYYNWSVEWSYASPDGFLRPTMLVNKQFPGPTIRVTKGTTFVVDVHNNLFDSGTSMHWHGMRQRGTPWMDGVGEVSQCPIQPRETFRYQVDTSDQVGSYWYHSHTGAQYADGVLGPIIIDDPDDPYFTAYGNKVAGDIEGHKDFDYTVVLSDWFHIPSHQVMMDALSGYSPYIHSRLPDSILVNGHGNCQRCPPKNHKLFTYHVKQGETYRFRFLHTGLVSQYALTLDEHFLTTIEADGQYTQPYKSNGIIMDAAQRYSVLITMNRPVGNYLTRVVAYFSASPSYKIVTYAWIHYEGAPPTDGLGPPPGDEPSPQSVQFKPEDLTPYYQVKVEEPTHSIKLTTSFSDVTKRWSLNNNVFQLPSTPVLLQAAFNPATTDFGPNTQVLKFRRGDKVRLILDNSSSQVHPFHKHGTSFTVVALGSGTYDPKASTMLPHPIKRDTVGVPAGGFAVIDFVTNNPGAWFFHCHLEFHLVLGLGLVILEDYETLPPLPEAMQSCGNFVQPIVDIGDKAGGNSTATTPPSPSLSKRRKAVAAAASTMLADDDGSTPPLPRPGHDVESLWSGENGELGGGVYAKQHGGVQLSERYRNSLHRWAKRGGKVEL